MRQQIKAYPVTSLCAVVRGSRSGFYDCLNRYEADNDSPLEDAVLGHRIKKN
jgi:hypothetical protein